MGNATTAALQPARPTADFWDDACRHLVASRPGDEEADRPLHRRPARKPRRRLHHPGTGDRRPPDLHQAAQTIWDRFVALTANSSHSLLPASVLALDAPQIRAAGLSARKVEYLCDLAQHFESGTVHVAEWQEMDDESIIEELVAIRGIGRWTAEMFLIFHLLRPECPAARRHRPDQGHQRQLLQRRAGLARRGPRGGRRLGAVPLGRNLVHLAQPRPVAAFLLKPANSDHEQEDTSSTSSSRSPTSKPRSTSCAMCRTSRRSTSPRRSTG